jgi:hypothetical protein
MIKYFQKAFQITNDNIILTTPLVLFLLLFSLYLGVSQRLPENFASAVLLFITILFMLSAFFAGWFFMIKKAVDLNKKEFIIEEDKAKASFALLKEITLGIGEYFFSFIGAILVYTILLFLFFFIGYKVGLHFIGNMNLNINDIKMMMSTPDGLKTFAASLSAEQFKKIQLWDFLFITLMGVYSFITMFFPAQIVNNTKNPFIAFFKSLTFTFKNFFSVLILFIYIYVLNFTISLVLSLSTIKTFSSFLSMLIYLASMLVYFYFIVYIIVLIFLYYDSANEEKTQNHSNSRSDSIGKE